MAPFIVLVADAATCVCCSGESSSTIETQYPTLIKAWRMLIRRASVMAAHPVLSGQRSAILSVRHSLNAVRSSCAPVASDMPRFEATRRPP